MRRTGGAAAFLLAVACVLVTASGAWACTAIASVSADPRSGAAGTFFVVQGRDFVPRAVEVRWGSTDGMVLGTAMGPNFEVRVAVPAVPPGDYHVIAVTEGYRASAPFRVTASPTTTTTTSSTTTSPSSSDIPPSDGSSSQPGSGSTEPSTPTGDDSHTGTSTTYTTAGPAAAPRTSSGGISSPSSPPASTTSTRRGAQRSASPTTTALSAVQVEGAAVVAEPPPPPLAPVTTVADVPPVRLLQPDLSSSGRTDNDDGPLSPFLLVGAVALVAGATSVVVRRRRTAGARNTSS